MVKLKKLRQQQTEKRKAEEGKNFPKQVIKNISPPVAEETNLEDLFEEDALTHAYQQWNKLWVRNSTLQIVFSSFLIFFMGLVYIRFVDRRVERSTGFRQLNYYQQRIYLHSENSW